MRNRENTAGQHSPTEIFIFNGANRGQIISPLTVKSRSHGLDGTSLLVPKSKTGKTDSDKSLEENKKISEPTLTEDRAEEIVANIESSRDNYEKFLDQQKRGTDRGALPPSGTRNSKKYQARSSVLDERGP
jgi:hypothetical protein